MSRVMDILEQLKAMKTLPNVAVRLTRMISDNSSSLEEFEDVIRMDPTLVLRLLKMVNSPLYALSSEVESIAEAIAFVGMDNLRNLIVMDILKNVVQDAPTKTGFSRTRLWLHSAVVGITSQIICERIFGRKGENSFLSGLIHDIGLIVEDQIVPELFRRVCIRRMSSNRPITIHEQRIIGTDHAELGYHIARDWRLPIEVQEGIRDHHETERGLRPESMGGILQISEYLAFRLDYTVQPGVNFALCPGLLKHIHENIQEYKAVAMDLPREIRKAESVLGLETE